jgi:hypothetical protein
MLKILLSALAILLLVGCLSNHEEQLPISEAKLGDILLDIHVAETAMNQLQIGPKKDSLANLYYDQIAEIHQVDREVMDTCLAIIQRNPEMMDRIYEKISEEVDKKAFNK